MVVDEIRALRTDPELLGRVLAAAHAAIDGKRAGLEEEQVNLRRSVERSHGELRKLASRSSIASDVSGQIAEIHDQTSGGKRRLAVIDVRLRKLAE